MAGFDDGNAVPLTVDEAGELIGELARSADRQRAAAAASIGRLAGALDTLAAVVAGVHVLAEDDDRGSPMSQLAARADAATRDAHRMVEELQTAALDGRLQAAPSNAESAVAQVIAVELDRALDRAQLLRLAREALSIDAHACHVLTLADQAARGTVTASSAVANMLAAVTRASATNSFIPRKLLAAAEQSDDAAGDAVTAAAAALRDVTEAQVATQRAARAAFVALESLVDLR